MVCHWLCQCRGAEDASRHHILVLCGKRTGGRANGADASSTGRASGTRFVTHRTRRSALAAQQPNKNPLLGVHAVARLLDDDALGAVDDFVGHLLAASGGKAVHEAGALLRVRHQFRVDLLVGEIAAAAFHLVLLAHAGPCIGVNTHCVGDRLPAAGHLVDPGVGLPGAGRVG